MKKIIALLLVAVMSFSLVACSENSKSPERMIAGDWQLLNGDTIITFYEDGTGKMNDMDGTFSWTYDETLNCYTAELEVSLSFTIETENNVRYFDVMGGLVRYYNIQDYEKANK